MQPHNWGLAGKIVYRDNVEPARAFRDAAFGEEMLRSASKEMLFAGRYAQLWQRRHLFADSTCANFDEGECFAIVADHVDFPL